MRDEFDPRRATIWRGSVTAMDERRIVAIGGVVPDNRLLEEFLVGLGSARRAPAARLLRADRQR